MFDTKNISQNDSFILIPKSLVETLMENQQKILAILEGNGIGKTKTIGDYISEEEAKDILGRKTTWFWSMRKKGRLSFTKIGNRIFYTKKDILKLLNDNRKEGFAK